MGWAPALGWHQKSRSAAVAVVRLHAVASVQVGDSIFQHSNGDGKSPFLMGLHVPLDDQGFADGRRPA
jgi:hypothetical protein